MKSFQFHAPVVAFLVIFATGQAFAAEFGWYPLNEGIGDTALDLINGQDGEIFMFDTGGLGPDGSVWVEDPVRGNVLGLNDAAWVQAGIIPPMTLEQDFSWSFWAKQGDGNGPNEIIIGNRYGSDGNDTVPREFIKFTPTKFEYHLDGAGENVDYPDIAQASNPAADIPSNDQWIHHTLVKDGTALTYYRDGTEANAGEFPTGQVSGDPLPFGFGGQDGREFWRGYLSDIQLYEDSLTSEHIQQVMGGGEAAGANLYARWLLNDGGGNLGEDSGPNGVEAMIADEFAGFEGSVWVDDPQRGTVLGLNGTHVDAGFIPVMDANNKFTWAFWARQDLSEPLASNNLIIGNRYGSDGNDTVPREFIKFTSDRFEFHMDGTGGGDLQYAPTGESPWLHHVAVKQGSRLAYYRDGVLIAEREIATGQLSEDFLPFAMGGQDGRETWRGLLSDVRLFDHSLTEGEILELFQGDSSEKPCDLNGSGTCTLEDLDLLVSEVIAGNKTVLDLDQWRADAATENGFGEPYLLGDANLDGTVDAQDLNVVGRNWQSATGLWSNGDFNADNRVNAGDLNGVGGNWQKSISTAAPASVPEPGGWLMLYAGLLSLSARRKKLSARR